MKEVLPAQRNDTNINAEILNCSQHLPVLRIHGPEQPKVRMQDDGSCSDVSSCDAALCEHQLPAGLNGGDQDAFNRIQLRCCC